MKTEILSFLNNEMLSVARAAEILVGGGLVAIPTETVYGLAANALDGEAVSSIFIAKGRPQDNPLIVHIADLDGLYPLVQSVPESALRLAERFWPGPLTVILPKSDVVAPQVSAGLSTVAVRMPSHPAARAVIKKAGLPLAAPSANLSGSPSPTSAAHVLSDLEGRIDAVLDGGECAVGVESTVVTLAGKTPRLLRPGGISPEQLREVLGEIEIDPAVLAALADNAVAASPGMKYKHYSPKADVSIIKGGLAEFSRYVGLHADEGCFALCFDGEEKEIPVPCVTCGAQNDPLAQAHRLFAALRELDAAGAKTVFARCPSAQGVGLAVYNRLLRAAAFKIVEQEESE